MPDPRKEMIRAAKAGDVAKIKSLLATDAELVHARDADGSTPLHCATWKGHREVAALLLSSHADVNARQQFVHARDLPAWQD